MRRAKTPRPLLPLLLLALVAAFVAVAHGARLADVDVDGSDAAAAEEDLVSAGSVVEDEDDPAEDNAASEVDDEGGDQALARSRVVKARTGGASESMDGWTRISDVSDLAKFKSPGVSSTTQDVDDAAGDDSAADEEDADSESTSSGVSSAAASGSGSAASAFESSSTEDLAFEEEPAETAEEAKSDMLRRLQDHNFFAAMKNLQDTINAINRGQVDGAAVNEVPGTVAAAEATSGSGSVAPEVGAETTPAPTPTAPQIPKDTPVLAFRANRRITFNNYSSGFIGGNESYILESKSLTKTEQLAVIIAEDATATVMSHASGKFWVFDDASRRIVWGDYSNALKVEIFANTMKDAIFFRAASKFVSFRAFSGDFAQDLQLCLTLVSALTENAFFSAPSVKSDAKQINSYIVKHRRATLEGGGELLPAFVAYDIAFAVLLDLPFADFLAPNTTRLELHNIIATMAQVMMVDVPDYAEEYPSFGKDLPALIDINQFAVANNIDEGESQGTYAASIFYVLGPAVSKNKVTAKIASFVGTIFNQALARDLDAKTTIFATNMTTYHNVLGNYYVYSCMLANWIDDITVLEKLNYTQMLYPEGRTDEPYLEKNKDGRYWFDVFVKLNITDFRSNSNLQEMGLIANGYLEKKFVETDTMIGHGMATAITTEVTAMVGKNDIQGLAKLARHEQFVAAVTVASEFCQRGSTSKLCVIPQINAQISVLAVADRTLFTSNETTSLVENADKDLQKYMKQLVKQKGSDGVIQSLTAKKQELMQFLKDNVDKAAKDIDDATLSTTLISAKMQSETQKQLAAHLTQASQFNRDSRLAEFEKKLKMMKRAIDSADAEQENLIEIIKGLGERAQVEAAITAVLDVFSVAVSALKVFNPYTGFQPGNIGDLVSDANDLSKSVTTLVTSSKLKDKVSNELPEKVADIVQRMVAYREEMQKLAAALQPILTDNAIDEAKLDEYASNFLAVYGNFKAPVSQPEIEEIRAFFTQIVDAFCAVINIAGFKSCVTAGGVVMQVFGGLGESVDLALDATSILFDVATEAVNAQNALQMGVDAENQLKSTEDAMTQLKDKWSGDEAKKETWWNEWKKAQSYSDAVTSIGLTMNQVLLLSTVVQFCNTDAYLSGGIPNKVCQDTVFSGKAISDDEIVKLISATSSVKPLPVTVSALIPTHPQYGQDSGFLDISRLMNQEKVSFQVPQNKTWLKTLNWNLADYDLKSTVFYVRSFEIFAPPRYADFATESSGVTVTVKSTGVSSFGPALDGKTFAIPMAHGSFASDYVAQPKDSGRCSGSVKLLGFSDCNPNMPTICPKNGILDDTSDSSLFLPSLFSPFRVSVSFKAQESARLRYENVTSPMYVQARVRLFAFKGVKKFVSSPDIEADPGSGSGELPLVTEGSQLANESESDDTEDADEDSSTESESPQPNTESPPGDDFRLRRRALQANDDDSEVSQDRCCVLGQYFDLMSRKCHVCPSGSVSQVGGLYCVAVTAADVNAAKIGSSTARNRLLRSS